MADDEEAVRRGRKGRSPSYPGINLQTALDRARTLYDREGSHPVPVDAILENWGYKPRSGGGLVALAALKKFDLLRDQGSGLGRQAQLTDLALRILLEDPASSERREAIRQAALSPTVHRELFERYGGRLPESDSGLRSHLVRERHFTPGGADEFIQELRATFAFAGLGGDATIPGESEDKDEPEDGMENDMALKDRDQQQSPKAGVQALRAPLGGGRSVEVRMPERMTDREWQLFEANLAAWKLATVEEPQTEQ